MADFSEEPIAWGQLQGAYGSAEEVGVLLSLIESGEDVWGDLIGEVLHQGSLCDATAPVTAWVIRFLNRATFANRTVSLGKAVRAKHHPSQKAWAFIFLSCAAASAIQEPKSSPRTAADVLDALRHGSTLYEKGLADHEVEVRLASAAIWKAVAADRAFAFASIARRYERETESEVRVAMLSALDALADSGKQWLDRLSLILQSPTSNREKFYAAAYLSRRLGSSTPEDTADQMAQLYPELQEAGYALEITNLEDPDDLFWASVRAMERSRAVGCLAKALELCTEKGGSSGARTIVKIMEWLLRLVSNDERRGWGSTGSSRGPKIEYFGVKPLNEAGGWLLSLEAGIALKAIVNKAEVWRIDTNLLSLFGLPRGRKELRDLSCSLSDRGSG